MTPARFLRVFRQRLRSLLDSRRQDSELDDELSFHLEQLTHEKIDEGLGADAARRAARLEFGHLVALREASRDTRRVAWVHDLLRDVGYGWRMLRRQPVFAGVAMLSLAIAIGASTAVIAAARAVLVSPLPFADGDRLVAIRTAAPDGARQNLGATYAEYFAWLDRSRTLDAFGASLSSPREIGAEPDGTPADRVATQAFTPELLRLLGVRPALGQVFEAASSPFHINARTAILSHGLWQRRYGGAVDVIGREIRIDGGARTIIGVLPHDFRYQSDNVDVWIPLVFGPDARRNTSAARLLLVTARLRPGVTVADAGAELDRLSLERARPLGSAHGWRVHVVPLREALYGWTRPLLLTLAAAALLMLVIACANVAGLLLARGTTRQRELWVRRSLGASRMRLVRQLLTETGLLAIGAGALGALLAIPALDAVAGVLGPPPGLPRVVGLTLDGPAIGFAAALSTFAWLAVGLLPAMAAVTARRGPGDAAQAPAGGERRGARIRSALVAAELALAAVLLVGAGLLLNSFLRLATRELHFDPDRLASFEYVIPARDYAREVQRSDDMPTFAIAADAADAIARVHRALTSVPGVEGVAGTSYPPVNSFVVPRVVARAIDRRDSPGAAHTVAVFFVTPHTFTVLRTPVVRGRDVQPGDHGSAPPVAVVNEAAGALLWPHRDALGRRVSIEFVPDLPARDVVGVVADVPVLRRSVSPEPIVYLPAAQPPSAFRGRAVNLFGTMTFMLRHSGDEAAVVEAARRAVREVDPRRPLANAGVVRRSLDARLMIEQRNYVAAIVLVGVTAVLLAAVGVYGILAFAVSARQRELSIRRVLGAGSWAVVGAIARRAAIISAAGIGTGLVLAALLSRLIASQLWGIAPTDPSTFAAVAGVIAAVAVGACVAPVRRALSVDPAHVLRVD